MVLEGHESVSIGDQEYWTVHQFADLTGKTTETIYSLIRRGNRVRKLKSLLFCSRRLIPVDELEQFPFVICGRPCALGIFVERFFIEDDTVCREELIYKE